MMGFPVGYTAGCVAKQLRGSQQQQDIRHTLVGNSWSVPVIAWLLSKLFSRLGLCPRYGPQEVMDLFTPSGLVYMQARLWRRPLRPLRGPCKDGGGQPLVEKLCNMISIKGEDILLTTPSSQLTKYHSASGLCAGPFVALAGCHWLEVARGSRAHQFARTPSRPYKP